MIFTEFFSMATGWPPYHYQVRMAESPELPVLLRIPTGAGKTEAAVLAWLYRRFEHPAQNVRDSAPRRLVYCLPMRTLVEQTVRRIEGWLTNLGMTDRVGVTILMGGEPREQWYLYPEKPFIVVGTQDMLLSRALNRGYGSSPFMWPVEYGLLNNDCLWVVDEVQLMANGLSTSTQLAGLRRKLETYGPAHSMWMSATVRPEWLATIDHPAPSDPQVLKLGQDDMASPVLGKRHHARKVVSEISIDRDNNYTRNVARLIANKHVRGTLTLSIVNTVERAQEVYRELNNTRHISLDAEKVLVHSRFRASEREKKQGAITGDMDPSGPGMVVVATQAIEAGVDISARTLITELAPWPSLVQRFGRCNRTGEDERGEIFWVDTGERSQDTVPYDPEKVGSARGRMKALEGKSAGPADLEALADDFEDIEHLIVIRRRDVVGLFDTTPDLSGSYVDVSQYVRGTDESSVSVFWRDLPGERPPEGEPKPLHSETITVPLGKNIDDYFKDDRRKAWVWDFIDDQWRQVQPRDIYPGMTLLLDAAHGGYSPDTGWDPSDRNLVELVPIVSAGVEDGQSSDPWSTSLRKLVILSEHCRHVEGAVKVALNGLSGWAIGSPIRSALELAALYHDAGKAHPAFQRMMMDLPEDEEPPEDQPPLAKSIGNRKNERRHFRHELGSALAILEHGSGLDDRTCDLAAYLAAAHHGKVRLGIRSLPGRRRPGGISNSNPDSAYLLGYQIAELETLPAVDLGEGLQIAETRLDLSIARIGLDGQGRRSWLDRSMALLDWLGPFRLACLEAIVRAADMRASREEQEANE